MLSQDLRPQKFSEVAGQELAVKALRAIAKNPDKAPRSIMLSGSFGVGKTSLARIFSKSLNCLNPQNGEPCGKCEHCLTQILESPNYLEYDSAIIGNVDTLRELKDTFFYLGDGYRVICLDEIHLMSKTAMSVFLKVLEENSSNVFFIFPTTDPDKVLPAIRSRSLELALSAVPHDSMYKNLMDNSVKLGVNLPASVAEVIISRSHGHMRNAHMMFDNYLLLGEEFLSAVKSSRDLYIKLLAISLKGDKVAINSVIGDLLNFTLVDLKEDYEAFLLEMIKVFTGVVAPQDNSISIIVKAISRRFLSVFSFLRSEPIISSFQSDSSFQSAMYLIFSTLSPSVEALKSPQI